MKTKTFNIDEDAQGVLKNSTLTQEGTTWKLVLPPGQLDRKLYVKVDKVLTAAGGKWNRAVRAHIFDRDPSEALNLATSSGKAVNLRQTFQSFYTPAPLAARMAALGNVRDKHVLEPSAGEGALVRAALDAGAKRVTWYEIDEVAAAKIPEAPNVAGGCFDFLCDILCDTIMRDAGPFDVVLMNPPFSGQQDINHVLGALSLLKRGGNLVAIMSPTAFTRTTKKTELFLDAISLHDYATTEIPSGTFEHTDVRTVLLSLTKS